MRSAAAGKAPVPGHRHFLTIAFALIGFAAVPGAAEHGENLTVACTIVGDTYRVTLRNDGDAPRKYWLVPAGDKPSMFRRVPIGASYFTRRPAEAEEKGQSALVVVSDTLLLPVTMAELKPGGVVEHSFELNALWGIWMQKNDPKLKEEKKQFRVVVNVYLNDHLQRSLKAESAWTEF